MTQAHKTVGAVVIFKDKWKFDMGWLPEDALDGKWEVLGMTCPGHTHVRSLVNPKIELPGWHSERFKTVPK